MNPIENLWIYLKKKVNLRRPSSLKNLEDIIIDEWYKIPNDVCYKLVKTMEKRIEEFLDLKEDIQNIKIYYAIFISEVFKSFKFCFKNYH